MCGVYVATHEMLVRKKIKRSKVVDIVPLFKIPKRKSGN
jgi:hypothetical protein